MEDGYAMLAVMICIVPLHSNTSRHGAARDRHGAARDVDVSA
jgi:hypothetical protein